MWLRLLIMIIFFLLTASSWLSAQEGYLLDDLSFIGNESFSDEELTEQISLYTLNWFERSILRKDKFVFTEEYLQADLNQLLYFYQQRGFLRVQIDYSYPEIDHENKTLDLEINVVEDTAVFVNEISFSLPDEWGNQAESIDSLINSVRNELILQKGVRFQDPDLNRDHDRIIDSFLNAGFAYVEVDYKLVLDDQEKNLDVIWQIDSGPLCNFGQIQILGAEEISENLLLDRIEFKTGDLYQKVLLDTTQRSIYALALFQVVTVKALLDNQKSNIIPVNITVKKSPGITTRFGVGYGSEAKFRVFADIQKSAFLGGARRLNLLLSHSSIEPYNIDLKFYQPAFIIRSMALLINPFFRKQDEPGFKVQRKGFNSTLLYSFAHRLTSSFAYTYEDVIRDTIDFADEIDIPEDRYRGLYDKSMISIGFVWNTSTPMFDPSRGFMASVNFVYNGLVTSVEFPFQKALLDQRAYVQIPPGILALRLKLGGILPIWENNYIPVEERFFSGGSYSVRGWARQELGPKDGQGRPLGGNSLLEFSSELRHPLYGIVGGVVFLDCGNVWLQSYKWYLNELRYSIGAGIRVGTPIGPVRLDFARPVFDEESLWQIHFSVGNAF